MNLFEIDATIKRCIKLEAGGFVDTETGEIIDTQAISELEMDKDKKIRNIACWIRNLESDEKELAEQIKRFNERKTATKNKKESLKAYLAAFLDGKKWENDEVKISWRRSESVEIDNGIDVRCLPEEYLRYKDPEVNKTLLKTDLKAGKIINGCALVEKQNIQIK